MAQSIEMPAVWPERKAPQSQLRQWVGPVALALVAALGTGTALPGPSFHAKAILSITDATSPVAAILTRATADKAASRPIMTRAAESLIGTGFPAPEPDLVERTAVATHIGGAKATGKTARLAADLSRLVTVRPGETPGSLEIIASTEVAARAAQVVSAVADALIVDQDDVIAQGRRRRDIDAAARVERLKSEAAAARRRLAALGGFEADPAQLLASAAAQIAKAQARANLIRAIIASGTPPLSDRRDLPSAIATLQTAYLDLSHQLAQARETLGERHTTIIGLNAELRQAAASLQAEWRRLGRTAEADLSAARDREASLRQVDISADVKKRAAIDEARQSVQLADDSVARALAAAGESAADERGYQLLLHPAIPSAPAGFSMLTRILLAGLAGLSVMSICGVAGRSRSKKLDPARTEIESVGAEHGPIEVASEGPMLPSVAEPASNRLSATSDGASNADGSVGEAADAEAILRQTMLDLMPQLEILDPTFGPVPTVMVAANEVIAETSRVALTLGRAAADCGHRVLLIEATRSRPKLAAAADPGADPVLLDLFGALRVALPVVVENGALYLAPHFPQGRRIASTLALDGDAPLLDDLGAEFDLIVIDGGRCADAVAAGWGADAYVRVGRYLSARDDQQFATALGVPNETIIGSVVGSTLARMPSKPAASALRGAIQHQRASKASASSTAAWSTAGRQALPRRKIATR